MSESVLAEFGNKPMVEAGAFQVYCRLPAAVKRLSDIGRFGGGAALL